LCLLLLRVRASTARSIFIQRRSRRRGATNATAAATEVRRPRRDGAERRSRRGGARKTMAAASSVQRVLKLLHGELALRSCGGMCDAGVCMCPCWCCCCVLVLVLLACA
jgi:hypothetical protein